MANNATFTFSVPEDTGSDYLQLYSSTTEDGSFSQVGSNIAYSYGSTTYEYEDLSATTWYKIRFYNSVDDQYSPYSQAIYGGSWQDNTKPMLAISTTTDGANYATIQEVRDFSGLSSDVVSNARISQGLRRARAIIDIKTDDMGIDRFSNFASDVQRKKYNATLRLIKEAEINYTLGMLYRGMIDDIIITAIKGTDSPANIRMGSTSVDTQNAARNSSSYRQLERLSSFYTSRATTLLAMIQPGSITITYRDKTTVRTPKFLWPDSIRGRY
jgi:hypothetical protein